jgi:hypothetical protein
VRLFVHAVGLTCSGGASMLLAWTNSRSAVDPSVVVFMVLLKC